MESSGFWPALGFLTIFLLFPVGVILYFTVDFKKLFSHRRTKEEMENDHLYELEIKKEAEAYFNSLEKSIAFSEFVKEKLASEDNKRLVKEQGLEFYKAMKKEFDEKKAA